MSFSTLKPEFVVQSFSWNTALQETSWHPKTLSLWELAHLCFWKPLLTYRLFPRLSGINSNYTEKEKCSGHLVSMPILLFFFFLSTILSKIAVTWQKLEILTLPETPTKILHFFLFGKYWHGSSYYFAHSLSLMPLIVKTVYKSKVLILFLPAKEKLSTLENIVKPGKTVFHSLGYVWPWVSKLSKLFEFQFPQW